ncbi:MAG TPA: rhomboid family intramembrane serine protease [Polyangia bacterium]
MMAPTFGSHTMDLNIVLFWSVLFFCLAGLGIALARLRWGGVGWAVLFVAILLMDVAGSLGNIRALVFASVLAWLLLVLLPGMLARLYHRRIVEQRYPSARRLAQVIACLHPADGWRQQPEVVKALELAQRGELSGALHVLRPLQTIKSVHGLGAMVIFFQISHQWDEFLVWQAKLPARLQKQPQLLQTMLRALGETGDRRGLVEFYQRHRQKIARLAPPAQRDIARLMLFAFCGRTQAVERLFRGNLSRLPATTQEFWMATSELAAGQPEAAQRRLQPLVAIDDARTRTSALRRLAQLTSPPPLADPALETVVNEAEIEQAHDARFGARPTLFARQARATQTLIALNLAMFGAEVLFGGSTNPATLYGLGALSPSAVRAGEWSRLAISLFLHWGPLHLMMNMVGLWVLGPFVERALGSRRFFFLYLLAGLGSMGALVALAPPSSAELVAGASGCIMGLVGATGAIMLRGWLREKAFSAKRRLAGVVVIVAMQTAFDALIPQVSMTAHLSGAAIGFAIALLWRDRLGAENAQPAGRISPGSQSH